MAALVFDSGALIALERGDRDVAAQLAAAATSGVEVMTSSTCVAQVWRDPARQARLARALAGFLECDLDAERARDCGVLLAHSKTRDIADAAVSLLVDDGDTILTSDPRDIERLLDATGTRARVRVV
jgi:predicted nucleic acid-binding protein